jgi:two-component system, LytTR family, response regulator
MQRVWHRSAEEASNHLKEIEEQFQYFNAFLRVHHSRLVNLNAVVKYVRGEGRYLVMKDDSTVNASKSRMEILLKKLHLNRV